MSNKYKLYLLILISLISMLFSFSANAQAPISNFTSESVNNLVTQLERIFHVHSQLLTQLHQQLIDNQRDIDLLRGQIQENQHQLSRVVEQQKQIYKQVHSFSNKEITSFQE